MELTLLLDYRKALRQRQQTWQSLDVERLRGLLADRGVRTVVMTFEEAANAERPLRGRLLHYTSTQDPGYRRFVDDVLLDLSRENTLIPRYDIFRAHEDKGYQEFVRRRAGLPGLPCWHYGNLKGLQACPGTWDFPLVLKGAGGYQSRRVGLVGDPRELARGVRRLNRAPGLLTYQVKHFLKKRLLRRRYFPEMYRDCPYGGNFILQEFVPGASDDWKVIVCGQRYYALRRRTRPGDFRASGSGRFAWEPPPPPVLDFAAEVFAALDVPMLSLDILQAGGVCHLLEFQGLHFGTLTIDGSGGYAVRTDEGWRSVQAPGDLEEAYAHALVRYLNAGRPAAAGPDCGP